MQRLPIGEQSFRNLREENKTYVDKTRQIYDLLHTGKFVFLARPRRFGKSLLTTTLQELFRGNKGALSGPMDRRQDRLAAAPGDLDQF